MRQTRKPQLALGEARIEDIKLDHKSRDDIPAVLLGLQHLYSHEETRAKLFSLLDEHIVPGTNRNVGRPGMELWRILVMGVLKQGLGCDFDRLHELVNQHRTVREFLGHGAFSQDDTYELQTIIDNVYLLTPELLSEIGQLVVESGHAVARKKPGEPLRGRCDSFVVETDCCFSQSVVESPRQLVAVFRSRISWDDGAIRERAGAVAFLMNRCCRSGEDVGARAPSVDKRWGSVSFSTACPHAP